VHSQTERQISNKVWGIPEFVPGTITEIAGPGLRIKTPLELNTGEKVLVIFRLNEIREQDPKSENGQIHTVHVIEGVGKVKHVSTFEDGLQVAVEFFGLDTQENAHEAALASKGD
ncbi:MAG: hypothetical protein ACYST2_04580, partial [Planctomycetota bacterium]